MIEKTTHSLLAAMRFTDDQHTLPVGFFHDRDDIAFCRSSILREVSLRFFIIMLRSIMPACAPLIFYKKTHPLTALNIL